MTRPDVAPTRLRVAIRLALELCLVFLCAPLAFVVLWWDPGLEKATKVRLTWVFGALVVVWAFVYIWVVDPAIRARP